MSKRLKPGESRPLYKWERVQTLAGYEYRCAACHEVKLSSKPRRTCSTACRVALHRYRKKAIE